MAKKESLKVTVKGPLFKSDAPEELVKAANTGLLDLVQLEGANKTGKLLKQGRGRVTGTLQRSIFGGASLQGDLHAQYDAGEASMGQNRVYATWIEGISPRNTTTSFKGYGMFKETREAIEKDNTMVDKYIGEAITRAFS
tara:strand:- start:1732 stop:2151 length:420 start_codon:yes stop_codon:yes gene_type:complete